MSVIIEATNLQTQNVTKGKLSFVDLAGSERCEPRMFSLYAAVKVPGVHRCRDLAAVRVLLSLQLALYKFSRASKRHLAIQAKLTPRFSSRVLRDMHS